MNNKEITQILDEFERSHWKDLDFKDQIEQFSMGEHEISPLHSRFKENQRDEASISFSQANYKIQQASLQQQQNQLQQQYGTANNNSLQQSIVFNQLAASQNINNMTIPTLPSLLASPRQIFQQNTMQYPLNSLSMMNFPQNADRQYLRTPSNRGDSILSQELQMQQQLGQSSLSMLQQQMQAQFQPQMNSCLYNNNPRLLNQSKMAFIVNNEGSIQPRRLSSSSSIRNQPLQVIKIDPPHQHVQLLYNDQQEQEHSQSSVHNTSIASSSVQRSSASHNSLVRNNFLPANAQGNITNLGKPSHCQPLKQKLQKEELKLQDSIQKGNTQSEDGNLTKKKRGRRKLEDDQYYQVSNDKIKEWEYQLIHSKNLSKKDKKILRNRISAQKSRNKKKEEFGTLTTQIEILRQKYYDLHDVIDQTLCPKCKEALTANLNIGTNKRLKLDKIPQMNLQGVSYPRQGLLKAILAFLGVLGVICMAYSPIYEKSFQQLTAGYSIGNNETAKIYQLYNQQQQQQQNYIVIQVKTVTQKSFNVMAFLHETVADVKSRIQNIEGIPVSYQVLTYEGQELADQGHISKLQDKDKIFLSIQKPQHLKLHKFSTLLKPQNLRHLDNDQVDIYVSYESSEPINFKRFKEIWEDVMGVKHKEHYEFFKNGVDIEDDNQIISENIFNDYEVSLKFNVCDSVGKQQNELNSHKLMEKYFQLSANQITLDEQMHVYKLMQSSESSFQIQQVNMKNFLNTTMILIDNDDDPFNEEMMIFRRTKPNKFEISSIMCSNDINVEPSISLPLSNMLYFFEQNEAGLKMTNNPRVRCVLSPIYNADIKL